MVTAIFLGKGFVMIINYLNNKKSLEKKIKQKLKLHGVCVVKNFLKFGTQKKIYKYFQKSFKVTRDIRISGPFRYLQHDFRRLDVGDSSINSRVARFILYCEWNNKKLFDLLNLIINLRNSISNLKKENFSYKLNRANSKRYKYCELIRMVQYPAGGGFLSMHRDKSELYPKEMINVLIPFSKRSNKKNKYFGSFCKGGLYYFKNKKKIDIEKILNVGDLVFHDQAILHGVSSVDYNKNFSLNNLNGRITLNFSIAKFLVSK